jgi:hypothetical protein
MLSKCHVKCLYILAQQKSVGKACKELMRQYGLDTRGNRQCAGVGPEGYYTVECHCCMPVLSRMMNT